MQVGNAPDNVRSGSKHVLRGRAQSWVLLIAGLLACTGCADVQFSSAFDDEAGAVHTLAVTFDRDELLRREAVRLERAVEEAAERANDDLDIAIIDTPDEIGLRATSTSSTPTNVALELNNLVNSLADRTNEQRVSPFHGTFESESGVAGRTAFDLDLFVDGDVLAEIIRDVIPDSLQQHAGRRTQEMIEVEYLATMPGEITESNGAPFGDNTTRWSIPLDETTIIEVESTTGQETPWLWVVVTVVAALVFIIATAAVVFAVLVRQHQTGSVRLPTAGDVDDERARAADLPHVSHPESLSGVGASLARIVDRVVNGNLTSERATRVHLEPAIEEEQHDGPDPERD